jgi:hypothetical protein
LRKLYKKGKGEAASPLRRAFAMYFLGKRRAEPDQLRGKGSCRKVYSGAGWVKPTNPWNKTIGISSSQLVYLLNHKTFRNFKRYSPGIPGLTLEGKENRPSRATAFRHLVPANYV